MDAPTVQEYGLVGVVVYLALREGAGLLKFAMGRLGNGKNGAPPLGERVAALETGLENLEHQLERIERKLDQLLEDRACERR